MFKRKKIDWLFVLPTDSLGGGAELVMQNLALHLYSTGATVKVVILHKKHSLGWEEYENMLKVRYLVFNNVYLGFLGLFPTLLWYSLRYKISHTFSSQTLINGCIGFFKRMGLLKKTTVIVRESNTIFELLHGKKLKMYAFAYKLGYAHTNLVICQTAYMKERLFESVPWLKEKVRTVVLPNPIPLGDIEKKAAQTITGLEKENYIVAAGRLARAKGFDLLIPAFKTVLQEFPCLKLFILGEGPERENLTRLIAELQLENNVFLKGFATNVYPYFKHARLCVISSRIEGFPNVLLQMMSQNTKVVATKSAGSIEDIDGVFTCPVNDIDALSTAITQCLKANTTFNRPLFDAFLGKRTVPSFLEAILNEIPAKP